MTPRRLFAVDAAGALFTAVLLGFVLVRFSTAFGVSERTFHFLAGFATAICIHSVLLALVDPPEWVPRVRAMAVINLAYAAVVLVVVVTRLDAITLLGAAYFVGEALVIGAIAAYEWRYAKRLTDPGTAPPR
jgi:dipeptide/tripeptide permease